ncbi:glycosyltransferase family 2 protein [Flavobacterium sp. ACN6]|uniref:glycosyltransferase family 2 protein n=1 Tax=Flavobacterium sp. ACN6 TaxID=1920426 RepID=UPI00209BECF3|nr:glycosyltransferase family A protein [Flavobacterium sp. ACN6]
MSGDYFISKRIGYVDSSPFINSNKKVNYPTWQMSSDIGGIHSSVLLALKDQIQLDKNFDYFINSIGKLAMPLGLLCYSEPHLIVESSKLQTNFRKNNFILFQFVRQHYKVQWIFLLFLNLVIYEGKVLLFPFLSSFLYRRRNLKQEILDEIEVQSSNTAIEKGTIDVVIPTMGRKKHLYDVLRDLSAQTHLPAKVIIVEQNTDTNSVSELDYLNNEKWPFHIKHIFTHQAGACNARNIALAEVESEWVFLSDDDVRLKADLNEKVLEKVAQYGINCITTSCLQKDEVLRYTKIHQSGIFGSGNSFLKSEFLKEVSFNKSLEFGYGEDTDFGLQLRNIGVDIIYFPELRILHLKAPIGGFRNKFIFPWELEGVSPKPSPTIMYVHSKYFSNLQLLGYKTVLFFKLNKFNVFAFSKFNKQWEISRNWSKKI